jgi:hypothetical protein
MLASTLPAVRDAARAVGVVFGPSVVVDAAAATLWRTRRKGGSRLARAAIGLAVLASVVLILLPTAIAIIATHKARSP